MLQVYGGDDLKKSTSKDLRLLIGVIIIVIVIGLMLSGKGNDSSESGMIPRPTSYSSTPSGLGALYETLDKSGYRVQRNLDPISTSIDDGVLFIIGPEMPLTADEYRDLRSWVSRGNLLVIVRNNDFNMSPPDKPDEGSVRSHPDCPSFLSDNARTLRVNEYDTVSHQGLVLDYQKKNKAAAKAVHPSIPLYSTDGSTSIAYSRWGLGEVIELGGPWMLTNSGIRFDDNLVMVLNALNHRDPSKKLHVTVDEYHHGYGQGKGMMSLISKPAKIGLGLLFAGFVILVFAVSRRFGRPIHLREASRQRGEYLSSMSSLIQRAQAIGLVRRELGGKFRREIAVALGCSPDSSDDAILAAAQLRCPDKVSDIADLLNAASAPAVRDESETGVFLLTRRWHKLRKELTK